MFTPTVLVRCMGRGSLASVVEGSVTFTPISFLFHPRPAVVIAARCSTLNNVQCVPDRSSIILSWFWPKKVYFTNGMTTFSLGRPFV